MVQRPSRLHIHGFLIPGVDTAEGFDHRPGVLRSQWLRITVTATGHDPEGPGQAGGRITDQKILSIGNGRFNVIKPVQKLHGGDRGQRDPVIDVTLI